MYELDVSNKTWVVPINDNPRYKWNQIPSNDTLYEFSALCWYLQYNVFFSMFFFEL